MPLMPCAWSPNPPSLTRFPCAAQARYRRVHEAFAAVVQGTAADLLKRLLLCLHRKLAPQPFVSSSAAGRNPDGEPPDQALCGLTSPAVTPRVYAVCRNEIVAEAEEGQVEGLLQVGLMNE